MRKFLFVVLTSLATMGAHAWELPTADALSESALAQPAYVEALVTIAPVPMPTAVIELTSYSPQNTGLRQAKKLKAVKLARAKSMLSRTAREQIALANTRATVAGRDRLDVSDDEDDDPSLDDQDLHRSFRQPKVAKTPDQADDDNNSSIDLPDHIKLRLLMARTKAVAAFSMSQADKASNTAGEDLSDVVKLRLYIARTRAVKAHREKFGAV